MPLWTFGATNRSGVLGAELESVETKLTARLSGSCTIAGKVDAQSSAALELVPAAAAVRAWRDGVLRFNGQVVEPLDRGLDFVTYIAADPYYFLANRRRETAVTYTATDAGAIARALITDERARETLHLKNTATFPTSVNRTLTYDRGKQIAEAIAELVNAENGFYFRIDPLNEGAEMAAFTILYPNSGSDRPGAQFFTTESGGNVEDFHETLGLPRTRVVTVGATIGDTQSLGSDDDATARDTYGLIEDEIAHTDIVETALLNALATEALELEPPATYKFSPISFQEDGDYVPALFDDFTVGDRVRVRAKKGPIDVDTWARVIEVTLAISDNGNTEKIESMVLESA